MVYGGAHGETARQIAEALNLSSDATQVHKAFELWRATLDKIGQRGYIRLHTANALWPDTTHEFLEEYLELARRFYGVDIRPVDYREARAAAETINAWVAEKTAGRITDLVPPNLDPLTRLILTNAIYFKGSWAEPFDMDETRDLPFHTSAGKKVKVPMMHQQGGFEYAESANSQMLGLEYAGGDLVMHVVLPKKKRGLERLEKTLSPTTLREWRSQVGGALVDVYLPRFTFASKFVLNQALKELGVTDAFEFGSADFSGLDGTDWFFIGQALHKAFVEVNEEGREAAAATAMGVTLGLPRFGRKPKPKVFRTGPSSWAEWRTLRRGEGALHVRRIGVTHRRPV